MKKIKAMGSRDAYIDNGTAYLKVNQHSPGSAYLKVAAQVMFIQSAIPPGTDIVLILNKEHPEVDKVQAQVDYINKTDIMKNAEIS